MHALVLGRRLTLQWEQINGCLDVDEHLQLGAVRQDDPAGTTTSTTLVANMARTVERFLSIYEVALDNIAHAPGAVRTCLGPLELVGEEAAIVAQEALRHMIARLGDMLKDIEEEAAFAATTARSGSGTSRPGPRQQIMTTEILMEEDHITGTNSGGGESQTETTVGVTVKRAQGLMFRLLGRVPGSGS